MNKIQIEIDLDDILYERTYDGDYREIETVKESVERQLKQGIIDEIKKSYLKEFKEQLFHDVMSEIKTEYMTLAKTKVPEMLEDALTRKYEIQDKWGGKSLTTCFMDEFVNELNKQLKYEKRSYDSDKNRFTKLVDNTIEQLTNQWKSDFDAHIKDQVLRDAYTYALDKVARAFNVRINDLKEKDE